jgi:cytochrome P450
MVVALRKSGFVISTVFALLHSTGQIAYCFVTPNDQDAKFMRFYTSSILENPYPSYKHWRAEHPIWQDEDTGDWIISRHDDVRSILKDSTQYSSKAMGGDSVALPLLADDPPRHTQLRGIVNKAFTSRMLRSIENNVVQIADSLVEGLAVGSEVDMVTGLTTPLPVAVISQMMAIPDERAADFKRWSDALTGTLAGASVADRQLEIAEMAGYFNGLIPVRRARPGSDLISSIVNAKFSGEGLADSEIVGFCMLLLIAGNETTTNLLGNFLNIMVDRPDLQQRLLEEPGLIEAAIEETLRYDGPVQYLRRKLLKPATFYGQEVQEGEVAHVIMGSANRDESCYPDADQFVLDRAKNHHHTFGFGIHFCIGAPLARLEAKIALKALFQRFKTFERGQSENERVASHLLRGFHHLHLVLAE